MTAQKRIILLITILAAVAIAVVSASFTILYNSAFEQQKIRLIETAKSHARLVEAIGKQALHNTKHLQDKNPDYDSFGATLSQFRDAHERCFHHTSTSEIVLAGLDGEQINFLVGCAQHNLDWANPVPLQSELAEPMRRALAGQSGTIIGLDYHGDMVVAAYEPVEVFGLGIVAKVDLADVRTPFVRAGFISGGIAIAFIFLGVFLFFRISKPIVFDLTNKETQLRDITSSIPGTVYQFVLNKDGTISIPYMSSAIESMIGIKADIFVQDANRIYDFIHLDDHSDFRDSLVQSAQSMTPWDHDFRVVTPDKKILWIKSNANPNLRLNGSILWNGVLTDITDHKQAEEEREHARKFMQTVIDGFPDSLMVINRDYTIALANRTYREMSTDQDPVAANLKCHQVSHNRETPCDRSKHPCPLEQVFATKAPMTVGHIHHDAEGHAIAMEVVATPIFDEEGEVVQIIETCRDITERKRVEDALRESEKRYRRITDTVTDYIYTVHVEDGRPAETIHGHACEAVTGYSSEEFRNDPYLWIQMIPQKDRDPVRDQVSQILLGDDPEPIEHRLMRKDGCVRWVTSVLVANRDGRGNLLSYDGLIRDITKRKRAEKALIESENSYQELFNSVMEGIGIVDENEIIKYVNPAFVKIFEENSANDMLEKNLLDYFSGSQENILRTETDKRKTGDNSQYELEMTTAKGRKKHLYASITPRLNEDNEYIGAIGTVLDITETKRLQELESRAERLEMAGKISGQIAHDFNNLLAPLIAYPDFIRDELPKNHPALTYLNSIEKSAERIADINQQLLTLGRRGHYNQEVINLNEIILLATKEMDNQPNTVACEINLCEDLMNIKGGGAQIHRIISNLLVNALDAIGEVGRIAIRTENYYVDDLSIAYGRVPKGEYVKVTLSDTGCGIPEDIIQKIFDPFFTSKTTDKKRGSGLGLSVVDTVMKDHNGYLDLSSKVGYGTSFYLYFPITREDTGGGDSDQFTGGTEMVLIIDDDDIQREVSSQLLSKLGYRISSVESGEEAIKFLRENPQDLLILDMVMPGGIDGAETYQRILEISPHQKAIILSGFSASDRVLEAQKLGAGAFVKKPLTKKAIAAAVRMELDRKIESVAT